MIEAELHDGTILAFPDGTPPDVVQRVAREQTAARRAASPSRQTASDAGPPIEVEGPGGVIVEFPAGTPMETMQRAMREHFGGPSEPATEPQATPNAPTQRWEGGVPVGGSPPAPAEDDVVSAVMGNNAPPSAPRSFGDRAKGLALSAAQGANRGLAAIAGLPVDIVNAAPMALNLLPGVDGIGPISERPFGGSQAIQAGGARLGYMLGAEVYEPQGMAERIAGRVGQEIGASAIPVAGAVGAGARMGVQGARQLAREGGNVATRLAGSAAEAGAVNPLGLARREAGFATAAGTGAGVANEVAGNPQSGDNFGSDLIGAIMGASAAALASPAVGVARNVASTALGRPGYANDIARQEVADALIDNSTDAARQFARTGSVDTTRLVETIMRDAPIERAIPGYQADLAERSGDAGLASFSYNQTRQRPGAAMNRRAANQAAVNDRMTELEPQGSPGQFRADLDAGRTERLDTANRATRTAQAEFEDAMGRLDVTTTPQERGQIVRGALQDALGAARTMERDQFWSRVDRFGSVDPSALADQFAKRLEAIPAPSLRNLPRDLLAYPQSLVPADETVRATVDLDTPLDRVTALRSELQDEARKARTTGNRNAERLIGGFVDDIDGFLESVPGLAPIIRQARDFSRQLNDRFTRAGRPAADVLAEREVAGNFRTTDSEVLPRFVQNDRGAPDSVDALLREADGVGQSDRVRGAIREQLADEVRRRGLADRPDQLDRFLADHSQVFDRFPELRQEIATAGTASRAAQRSAADEAAARVELTTPGRSAAASYLRYDDNRTVDAVRTVTNAPQPERAARDLLDMAGRTPETMQNARAAFWRLLKEEGQASQRDLSGGRPWQGRYLSDFLADPKNDAVARVLYEDRPQELADMRQVFDALAGADPTTRAKLPNSSGTAQALSGKFDPALSASSISSRLRSVNRGQLSPTIAIIDVAATFLRRRSAQMQAGAIGRLQDEVIQNPALAAQLLEEYNPATFAAKRRMILQRYGVRATQVVNLMDEIHAEETGEDDTMRAIMGDANDGFQGTTVKVPWGGPRQ